jgi:hypothetical protein
VPHTISRRVWGVKVKLHISLTSALGGGEWSFSHYLYYVEGKNLQYHLIRGWVASRAGLDVVAMKKQSLPLLGSNCPACSKLIY